MWNESADSMSEAALPAVPLLLVALMLPVTLVLLGLMNRRTTRNKCCLSSFGSTCTDTLTSLCRDESDTPVTTMVQGWVDDEVIMLRERSNIFVRLAEEWSKESWLINRKQAKAKRGKYSQRNAGPSLTVTASLKVSFLHHQDPCSHLCATLKSGSGVAHYNMERARKAKGKR